MGKVDLALKGLLIDKSNLFSPGRLMSEEIQRDIAAVEGQKLNLIKAWQKCDQDMFTLSRYTRNELLTLRWNLRRKYHTKRFSRSGSRTHVFLYWNRPESVQEVNKILEHQPDRHRVLSMMKIYEIARINLTVRSLILRHIEEQANKAGSYDLLGKITADHIEQSQHLLESL